MQRTNFFLQFVRLSSASRPDCRAPSESTWMNAFNFGFSLSICARCASTSSTGEISFLRIFSAMETAERKIKSFMNFFLAMRDRAFVSLPESGDGARPWPVRPAAAAQWRRESIATPLRPGAPSCGGSGDSSLHPEQFRASSSFGPARSWRASLTRSITPSFVLTPLAKF